MTDPGQDITDAINADPPVPPEALPDGDAREAGLTVLYDLAVPLLLEAYGTEMPPEQAAITALGGRIRAEVKRIYAAGVAAGRTQAATELAATFSRIADSERQSLVSTPPEYFEEQVRYRARSAAFGRAAEIAERSCG